MAQAFGVQAKLKLIEVPKGTSIIAKEFSPGRPDPTPINVIYQHTSDLTELSLDVKCSDEYDVEQGEEAVDAGQPEDAPTLAIAEKLQKLVEETQEDALELAKALQDQISDGEVEIETQGRQIVIRIREKGSFKSGSAELHHGYIPVLQQVRNVIAAQEGQVSVHGHTDNIPIRTSRFRSNWELSSSRAVSVAHEILTGGYVDPRRITVSGFSATHPLTDNDTPEGRSRNRRVEIVIHQGLDKETLKDIQTLNNEDPDLLKELDLSPMPNFELSPHEIF